MVSSACSKGAGNDDGSAFWPSSSTQPNGDPFEDDDETEGGEGSSGSGSTSASVDDDSGGGAASTSGMPGATTGGAETGVGGSTSGAEMPGMGQPAMGMYADCYEPDLANCTADANVCLMVMALMSGFCTHDECTMPSDCDAAPLDATATPMCVTGMDPEGGDVGLCALDCSADKTCPAGMMCVENVSFGEGYPQYDFCV